MDKLKDILWPIVVVGGLGGFIDFLIGKAGQEKAKDFLLRWWVRFDNVYWRNFGREEGLFAGQLIEQWLGKRIWSFRRIVVAFALFTTFLSVAYVLSLIINPYNISCYYCQYIFCDLCRSNGDYTGYYYAHYGVLIITVLFYFTASISFIKFITVRTAYLCGVGEARNLLVYLVGLIVYYILLIYVSPWLAGYRENFSALTFRGSLASESDIQALVNAPYVMFSVITYLKRGEIDRTALFMLACFPSLLRFAISIVFVGSFLLRPVVMRPVSLVWARIIESEKPVFTVIFGGAAAFATAINEAAKHLSG